MILTPAYGRDYKSKKEVLVDFDMNKDFILNGLFRPVYINKEQIEKGEKVTFRYNKLRSVFIHTV